MHQDRLGSNVAISEEALDAAGKLTTAIPVIVEHRGFDAFGKALDGGWGTTNNGMLTLLGSELFNSGKRNQRGFTGHEHLDEFGLIHMNGRAYDYNVGRFYGVDPIIQFPGNSQSLNPYSYLMNNPLSGTDPTGYCIRETGSNICLGKEQKVNVTDAEGNSIGNVTKTTDRSGIVSYSNFRPNRANGASQNQAPSGSSTDGQNDTASIQSQRDRLANTADRIAGALDAVGEAIAPCSSDSSDEGCAGQVVVGAVVGAVAGKVLAKEISAPGAFTKWKNDFLDRVAKAGDLERNVQGVTTTNNLIGGMCGGMSCFVAGTPVMTPAGLRPIETISVGELVQARNELTGELKWQRVEQVIVTHDREVWDYTFIDAQGQQETLGATPIHPFHTPNGEWIEVGKLAIGQQVSSLDGRVLRLQAKSLRAQGETTYNFEIAEDHNYFVGTLGAWVHNGAGPERCVVCPDLGKEAVEELTRLRLQSRLGVNIFGATSQNAPDYFDAAGRTYDQMGNPAMTPFWEEQRSQFFNQIQIHLRKADYTVIDLTGFPSNIRNEVGNHVMNLPESQFDRIIPIGF